MGKLNMNLLKGVEQQESIIDKSKGGNASGTSQKTQGQPEKIRFKSTDEKEKDGNQADMKLQRQSFSFRAEPHRIEEWRLYAESIGARDLGVLWSAAIDEYIENHGLTADQQIVYDLKKQAYDAQKRVNNGK